MKLETTNLAHVWTVLSANEKKMHNWVESGQKLETSNFAQRWTAVSTDEK